MKYFDLNFSMYSFEIFNSIKMSQPISLKEKVIKECTDLARDSFGGQGIGEDDVGRHVLDSSTAIFVRDSFDRLCGFASSLTIKIEDFYIIYFQSLVVSNDYKRAGLPKILIALRIIESVNQIKLMDDHIDDNHILLGGRTQSPLMYRISQTKSGLYPNPDGFIDSRIKSIGRNFARYLYEDDCAHSQYQIPFVFDNETFVAKSAYQFAADREKGEVHLYDEGMPPSGDPQIDSYMKRNVDWKNGDALILLGYYRNKKIEQVLIDTKEIIDYCYANQVEPKQAIASV